MKKLNNAQLKAIMKENAPFAEIVEKASAKGLFAGSYAMDRADAYYTARHILASRKA